MQLSLHSFAERHELSKSLFVLFTRLGPLPSNLVVLLDPVVVFTNIIVAACTQESVPFITPGLCDVKLSRHEVVNYQAIKHVPLLQIRLKFLEVLFPG